jgi:hypothetical protein
MVPDLFWQTDVRISKISSANRLASTTPKRGIDRDLERVSTRQLLDRSCVRFDASSVSHILSVSTRRGAEHRVGRERRAGNASLGLPGVAEVLSIAMPASRSVHHARFAKKQPGKLLPN